MTILDLGTTGVRLVAARTALSMMAESVGA